MIPRPYQVEMANQAVELLNEHNIAYFAAEERTGKTLASILVGELLEDISYVIVITKKIALEGWNETLAKYKPKVPFVVTNYHQANKLVIPKAKVLMILDESHTYIAGYPKRSAMWKTISLLCKQQKILYVSATPYAQGVQQLFNQFALSSYSPWKIYKTFYAWFNIYGFPYTIKLQGRDCNQYDRVNTEKTLSDVNHLFITKTRKELGFEHEPKDILHYIELDQVTKDVYNELLEHKIVEFYAGTLVCETKSKLRPALHMIEGGVTKIKDDYLMLKNREKIDYILKHFGDTKDTVIMYNYIAEGNKLMANFKNCEILHATSFAEGVDLSMYKHLIIYSMNFSTSKHTQRRARQANMNRKEEINVHFLLVKKAISEEVYKTVALNKRNYVDSLFERNTL